MAIERVATTDIAWIDGWSWSNSGLVLRALCCAQSRCRFDEARASELSLASACDPRHYPRAATRCTGFQIDDLSRLDRLVDPGELAGLLRRDLVNTRHAIYRFQTNEGRIYIPAMLLLRELWLWSEPALNLLLTPHSLDLYVGRRCVDNGKAYSSVDKVFCSTGHGVKTQRRMAWLSQSEDARRSWRSVLTFAHQGKLDVLLPQASLRGWAWGIDLAPGLLVNRILSPYLTFDIPEPDLQIRIGPRLYRCPEQPPRQKGYLRFLSGDTVA